MYDRNAIKIYTDGSAKPNPGKGGLAFVAEYPDDSNKDNFEFNKGFKLSTNNRMELMAIVEVFKWLQKECSRIELTRAIIITDSEYVHSNHSNVQYWKKDKWINKDGKPYENDDLWDSFLKEHQKVPIRTELTWHKGKKNEILKRVDKLAKESADRGIETDYGYKTGKFTSSRTDNPSAATLFNTKGQDCLIRVFQKKIYGRNESIYKITFDLWDEGQNKYVAKYVAYKDDNSFELNRNNCYKVKFSSSGLPKIIEAEHIDYLK
jgi:ribonuclease HI